MDPIGLCFAESFRGIKHFQVLKKAKTVKLKVQCTFPQTKLYTSKNDWTSFGTLLCRLPSGDKTFLKFQKGGLPRQIENPIYVF